MYNPNDPFGAGDDISAQRAKEAKENARAASYAEAGVSPQDYARKFPQNQAMGNPDGATPYERLLGKAPPGIQSMLGMPPPMSEFVKDPRDNTEAGEAAYKQHLGDYQKTVQDWAKTQPGYQPPAGQAAQPTQNVTDPLGAQPAQPATAPTPFRNDKGVEISSTYAAAYPGAASAMGYKAPTGATPATAAPGQPQISSTYAAAYPGTAAAMGYAAPSGTTPATTAPAQPPALGAAPGQAPQPTPTMTAAPLAPRPPTAAGRSIMAGTYGAGANNSYGMGSGWDQEKYDQPLG